MARTIPLTVCLLLASLPVAAQTIEVRDGAALELEICRIHADVEEGVALVDVDQTFRNRTGNQLEGTYRFRLPEEAVVHSFSMWMNGVEKHGRVLEAKAARQVYESIVRRRKDPALLEQEGWRSFRVRVFPIPPRDVVRIRLRYAYVLPDDLGLMTLEVPMLANAGKIGEASFRATVRGHRALSMLECASHPDAKVVRDGPTGEVTWSAEGCRPGEAFRVRLMHEHQGLDLAFLAHRAPDEEEGVFLVRVVPRLLDPAPLPRDVVFVLDRSGSMQGKKIEQARKALLHGLGTLREGDRFEILTFASDVTAVQRTLTPVTPETITAARGYVERIEANGGTNIDGALRQALTMRAKSSDRLFLLVFLTDGEPTIGEKNPKRIIERFRKGSEQRVRLFAFGVGDGVKDFLLTHLARDSRGTAVYVRENEDLEVKLSSLFTKVGHPLVASPEILVEGAEVRSIVPQPLPDCYRGEALVLAGRYRGGGEGRVRLKGRSGKGPVELNVGALFPKGAVARPHVAQLWAKMQIDELLDDLRVHGANEEIRQSIIHLGVKYQVVTPYTSFLVVEDNVHVPDARELARVPDAPPPPATARAPVAPGGGKVYRGPSASGVPGRMDPADPAPPADGGVPTPPPSAGGGGSGGAVAGAPRRASSPPSAGSGGYRGPWGEVPPNMRKPEDPPPADEAGGGASAPPSSVAGTPSPGGAASGGGGSSGHSGKGAGPAPTTFDSWQFWWGYNRDALQGLVSGRRGVTTTPDRDPMILKVLPALERVLDGAKLHFAIRGRAALSLARLGATRPSVAERIGLRLVVLMRDEAEHFSVQESAALALGVLGRRDPATLDALCDRLLDPRAKNSRTRAFCALALGLLRVPAGDPGHDRVVKALRAVARDETLPHLNEGACALIAMGLSGDATLLPDLVVAAHDGVAGTRALGDLERSHAVSALGRLAAEIDGADAKRTIDVLKKIALSGETHSSRSAAIALGQVGSRADLTTSSRRNVFRVLQYMIRKAESQAAAFATIALARTGAAAKDPGLRMTVVNELTSQMRTGTNHGRPYGALALALYGRTRPDAARADIAQDVRRDFERWRGDPRNRAALAIALGLLGDKKAVPELTKVLADRGQFKILRGACALGLGFLGESGGTKAEVVRELVADRDPQLRLNTTLAVGLLRDRDSSKQLLEILRSPRSSLSVQWSTSLALGAIADDAVVDALLAMLGDEKVQDLNRAFAASALGNIADESPEPTLWRLTTDLNYRAGFNAIEEAVTK